MGFGMRKEVYTRKPKKVFKKIKDYRQGENIKIKPYTVRPYDHEIILELRSRSIKAQKEQQIRTVLLLIGSIIGGLLLVEGIKWWIMHW